jgi:hypothetical protein
MPTAMPRLFATDALYLLSPAISVCRHYFHTRSLREIYYAIVEPPYFATVIAACRRHAAPCHAMPRDDANIIFAQPRENRRLYIISEYRVYCSRLSEFIFTTAIASTLHAFIIYAAERPLTCPTWFHVSAIFYMRMPPLSVLRRHILYLS